VTRPLARAAVLVAVEAVVLVGLGVAALVAALAGDPETRSGATVGALLVGLSGAALLLVARGLQRRSRAARAPAVVVQLLAVPVGLGLADSGIWLVAVPVLGLALLVLVALVVDARR
jgi:hypothetical protein